MTTSDAGPGRPVPDTDDLRLLAEIINNQAIGLPQAAWNARMSQSEAAARMVTMAERGMPLRLVAEGDRELLWRIAQAGPATSSFALPPAAGAPAGPRDAEPPQISSPAGPGKAAGPAAASGPQATPPPEPADRRPADAGAVQVESQPVQQLVLAPNPSPAAGQRPVQLPPVSTVPPHEQAIAGAVPLGQPPFGTAATAEPTTDEPPADDSNHNDPAPSGATAIATESTPVFDPTGATPDPPSRLRPPPPPPAPPAPQESLASPDAAAAANPGSSPTRRMMVSGRPMQSVTGLSGENLDVSLQQIIDPADPILTSVGHRLAPGERALLVQTSIGNPGPVDDESLSDEYLVVQGSTGEVLHKAPIVVAGYPAHRVGVPANSLVSGWTVFLVPAATEVTEVRWSVRPDLPDRTISWGFGPA